MRSNSKNSMPWSLSQWLSESLTLFNPFHNVIMTKLKPRKIFRTYRTYWPHSEGHLELWSRRESQEKTNLPSSNSSICQYSMMARALMGHRPPALRWSLPNLELVGGISNTEERGGVMVWNTNGIKVKVIRTTIRMRNVWGCRNTTSRRLPMTRSYIWSRRTENENYTVPMADWDGLTIFFLETSLVNTCTRPGYH